MITVINQILSIITLIGQVIVLVLLFSWLFKQQLVIKFFGKKALTFAFSVALIATLGSLYYSEIAGYEPCKLCWFQRIFMYPQVILLGLALLKKDKDIASYSLILSFIGAVIAGYHYLLQFGVVQSAPCSAVGYSISCSQRFVAEFGYLTIPLMSFTAFVMMILFWLASRRSRDNY